MIAVEAHPLRRTSGIDATCGTSTSATSHGSEPPVTAGRKIPTPIRTNADRARERHRSARTRPAPATANPHTRPTTSGR